jgi:CBS domain-containing protein
VDVPVRNVMQTHIPVVPSHVSVDELMIRQLTQPDERTMLVAEGENVVGMVVMNDVERSSKEKADSTPVSEIMTPVSRLEYVTPDQDVAEAFDRLQRLELRQMPVVLNNRIVGLLHRKDILHWLQLRSELRS